MSIYSALLPSSSSSYIYFYIMYYSFYIFITGLTSGWSHHLAFGLLRRSTGRTARFMDFVADQLVALFSIHFYSVLTSPSTSWLGCSVLDSSPTNWSDCPLLHHQLHWGSPAKLGTPRCLDCSSLHRQLSWGLSVWILRARVAS